MIKKIRDESSDIWNKVWHKDSYSRDELRKLKAKEKVDLLERYINIKADTVVADFGCGGGYLSTEIFNRYKCHIIGYDFSKVAIEVAKAKSPSAERISYMNCSVLETNLRDATCDVVICSGIIEHISKQDAIFSEIYRVLKDNGKVFISTSNKRSSVYWQRRIKELLGIWRYGYQYNYELNELVAILEKFQFDIIYSTTIASIEDLRAEALIDKALTSRLTNWGRYIVVICQKKRSL